MKVEAGDLGECTGAESAMLVHGPCGCVNACPAATGKASFEIRSRIVRHCSPTLAGLKCGSMFKVCGLDRIGSEEMVSEEIRHHHDRGLSYRVLFRDRCGTLFYIYRPKLLAKRMSESGVAEFLESYGYIGLDVEGMVRRLENRFEECGMPPEVGIFLDYPLEDVVGYIENDGRGCKMIGCWKVYGDVEQAEVRFRNYRDCRDTFLRRLSEGFGLESMVVRC